MDPFTLSSELPASQSDWLRLEYPLPDVQISIKTVQKTCQGPFLPAHRLPHKHNFLSRGPLPALKTREKAVLLPYLYSTLPQCHVDRVIPRKSPRAADGHLKRGKIGENRSMLLRGNSMEVDGKLKQVMYHKHSLSSICQPITLKVKCDFSRGKLPKKTAFPPATPNITFTSTDIFQQSAALKGNTTPENRKFSPGKQVLLTADFSTASITQNRSNLPSHKSSKSPLSSASEMISEGLAEEMNVSLTPFHCLIDINASLESKAYGYLHRTCPVAALASVTHTNTINVRITGEKEAKCTCFCPLHRRNIALFSLKGLNSAQISPLDQFPPTLKCVIRPVKPETTLPILLIHLEGVLFTYKSHANTGFTCYMRPGTVSGLHLLSNSFELVFISDFLPEKMYKILEFLLQKGVQFYAVYAVKREMYWGREFCMRYEGIVEDLGREKEEIAVLGALSSEIWEKDETCLYTCTGLGVRLHAKYLPVVLPTHSQRPIFTYLVQHISSEDDCNSLLFTSISLEICKFHSKLGSSPSPLTHFFLTKRIHEAYFSSLLPPLICETLSCYQLPDIGHCTVHRGPVGLGHSLPDNKVAVIHSGKQRFRGKLEIVDLEMTLETGKQTTLMDFATVIE